jgi:hypothetical protein
VDPVVTTDEVDLLDDACERIFGRSNGSVPKRETSGDGDSSSGAEL